MNRQLNPNNYRHQGTHECRRRLLHRLIYIWAGDHMPPARIAPVRDYTPPTPPPVNRASHYLIHRETGVCIRRYPKVRGKAAVKAAKRARITARKLAAARMARRAS